MYKTYRPTPATATATDRALIEQRWKSYRRSQTQAAIDKAGKR